MVTVCFPHFRGRAPQLRTLIDVNERINHWLWRQSISLHRDPVGEQWRGGSFTRNFDGKVNYQGRCRRNLWKQVLHSVGAPLGNLGEGVLLLGILR